MEAAAGGAEEGDEGIDEIGELVEAQEAEPGELTGGPSSVFVDDPIGGGALDIDG